MHTTGFSGEALPLCNGDFEVVTFTASIHPRPPLPPKHTWPHTQDAHDWFTDEALPLWNGAQQDEDAESLASLFEEAVTIVRF